VHWTVHSSMCNDHHFICPSKLWTQKGEMNLKHILANLGLTQAECRQNFNSMSLERQKEIFDILHRHTNSTFATFKSHFGYSTNYNAADVARILALRLESQMNVRASETMYDRFSSAHSILKNFMELGSRATPSLAQAVEKYKIALVDIRTLAFIAVSQGHIISTARYYMVNVHKASNVLYLTSSRHCLNLFTHSLLRFYGTNVRRTSRPFIVAVPVSMDNVEWYLIIGLMPLREIVNDTTRKNKIGRLFEEIIADLGITVHRDSFESNIVFIRAGDRVRFFNSLEAKME